MVASKYVARSFFYYPKEGSPLFEEAMVDIRATDELLKGKLPASTGNGGSGHLPPDACGNIKLLSPGIYYQIYKVDQLPSTMVFHSPTIGQEYTKMAADIPTDKAFRYTLLKRSEGQHHCHMLVTSNSMAHHFPFRYELGLERSIQTMATMARNAENNM